MTQEYASKGFTFIFVYIREAHPGENYPAHRSMEQRLAHVQAFRERCNTHRPILVDDLAGSGHRLYGDLPNMTYLIGRNGRVLFRSDWTDPPTIEFVLNYLIHMRERRRAGERLTPFYAEFTGYRKNDPTEFHEGLKLSGQQAVDDFARMVKVWDQQASRPSRLDE